MSTSRNGCTQSLKLLTVGLCLLLLTGCMSTQTRKDAESSGRTYAPYEGTANAFKMTAMPLFEGGCCSSEPMILSCPPLAVLVSAGFAADIPGSALNDTLNLPNDLRKRAESQSAAAE